MTWRCANPACGRAFEPGTNGNRRYCNAECQYRAAHPIVTRPCPTCGAPVVTRGFKRYCGKRCRYMAQTPEVKNRRRPYGPNNTRPVKSRWTIVGDAVVEDNIEFAACRCQHGHEQVIAVDVRPPPACEVCQRAGLVADTSSLENEACGTI